MKYCTYCGRPLQDNEQCTCEESLRQQNVSSNQEGFEQTATELAPSNEQQDSTTSTVEPQQQDTTNNEWRASETTQPNFEFNSNEQPGQQYSQFNPNSQPGQQFSQFNPNGWSGQQNSQFNPNGGPGQQYSQFSQYGGPTQAAPQKPNAFVNALKNIVPYVKALIHKPADTIKRSADSTDLPLSIVLYILYFASALLCGMVSFSKLFHSFGAFLGGGYNLARYIKLPYGSITVAIFFIVILQIAFTVLTVFIMRSIHHGKYNIKQIIAASSGIFVYQTICFLIATLFALFSLTLFIITIIVTGISFLIMFFFTSKTLCEKDDNSSFLVSAIIATSILVCVSTFATIKIAQASAKSAAKSSAKKSASSIYEGIFGYDEDDYGYDEDDIEDLLGDLFD